jgi:hypothetical protein
MVAKYLFLTLFFYTLSLTSVMINTLLEYVLNLYPEDWWRPNFYWQYIIQFGCIRDSMIMLSSVFIAFFYVEVFVKEKTPKIRSFLLFYSVITILFVILFIIGFYWIDYYQYYLAVDLPKFIEMLPTSMYKLIIVLIHTAIVYIPLTIQSLILRQRLKREDANANAEYVRKLAYIFMMAFSILGLFFFSLLDNLSGREFSFWYYCTFISEAAASLFGYFGFIKELKKEDA